MIDLEWSTRITDDSLILADVIELSVAFIAEHNGYFNQSEFIHRIASEILDDQDQDFHYGDAIDSFVPKYEEAVGVIRNRAIWLGEAYPFRVESNEVQMDHSCASTDALPYLFMLICSNRKFAPDLYDDLPSQFEYLCKEALKPLFPEWTDVLLFSNDSNDRKSVFGVPANQAVPALADKLNTKPVDHANPGTGGREYGIDIVAICPLGDDSSYSWFAFAQCTLGARWWKKRHEAKAESELTSFIHLTAHHTNFLMIPYMPRVSLDGWRVDGGKTGGCILCDRYRICFLLGKSATFRYDNPPVQLASIFNTIESQLVV